MALDTAAKRDSAMLDFGGMPWPPDSTAFTASRRLIMLEFYSGIAASDLTAGIWQSGASSIRPTLSGRVAMQPAIGGNVRLN